MTRARVPRPHEVAAARRDPRLLRAATERQNDTAWRTRGVCQSVDPETFFPAPTDPPDAAIALCGTCDVRGACLAWALDAGDCHGVWGGTTARERRAMVVAWRTPEQSEENPYAEQPSTTPARTLGPEKPARVAGGRRGRRGATGVQHERGPAGVQHEPESPPVFIPLQRTAPLEALVG